MTYYTLRNSLVRDNVGHYPQAGEVRYHCEQWNLTGSNNPAPHMPGFEPVSSNAILHQSAIPTDLVSVSNRDFCDKLLVSGKLKAILEMYTTSGLQFFPSDRIAGTNILRDYFLLNAFDLNFEFIDFKQSDILLQSLGQSGFRCASPLPASSLQQFLSIQDNLPEQSRIFIDKTAVYPDVAAHFFKIRYTEADCEYLLSEPLRQAIQKTGCTGLDYQPAGASTRKWLKTCFSAARLQVI